MSSPCSRDLAPFFPSRRRICRWSPNCGRVVGALIGIVLVTHGRLATEFVAALEHVVGPQVQIASVCIGPEDDMEQRRQEILTRSAMSIPAKARCC